MAAIVGILLRNNSHKQKAYETLNLQKQETERQKAKAQDALTELQFTQKQLIQSAKMASLGELTAGIAHEIQNPLNFVNNFSELSVELLNELKEGTASKSLSERAGTDEIINDLEIEIENGNNSSIRFTRSVNTVQLVCNEILIDGFISIIFSQISRYIGIKKGSPPKKWASSI